MKYSFISVSFIYLYWELNMYSVYLLTPNLQKKLRPRLVLYVLYYQVKIVIYFEHGTWSVPYSSGCHKGVYPEPI